MMAPQLRALLVTAAFSVGSGLATLVACSSFSPSEVQPLPEAAASDDASLDAPLDTASDAEDLDAGDVARPDGMVQVSNFFIDSLEVTNREYDLFLERRASGSDTTELSTFCQWKLDAGPPPPCTRSAGDQKPVGCVDWCDADLYCRGNGKRLCGARGGGPTPSGETGNRFVSQWMRACGSDDADRSYPYGDAGEPKKCQTQDHPSAGSTVDVGTLPGCQGSVPGLYDMSGNVQEWEDNCGPPPADAGPSKASCFVRGGGFSNPTASSSCSFLSPPYPRSFAVTQVGFRCCAP